MKNNKRKILRIIMVFAIVALGARYSYYEYYLGAKKKAISKHPDGKLKNSSLRESLKPLGSQVKKSVTKVQPSIGVSRKGATTTTMRAAAQKFPVKVSPRVYLINSSEYSQFDNVYSLEAAKLDEYSFDRIIKRIRGSVIVVSDRPILGLKNKVLLNNNTGRLSSQTGTIELTLKDFSKLDIILGEYSLEKVSLFPSAKIALVNPQNHEELTTIYSKLKSDSRFSRVYLEIISESPTNKLR